MSRFLTTNGVAIQRSTCCPDARHFDSGWIRIGSEVYRIWWMILNAHWFCFWLVLLLCWWSSDSRTVTHRYDFAYPDRLQDWVKTDVSFPNFLAPVSEHVMQPWLRPICACVASLQSGTTQACQPRYKVASCKLLVVASSSWCLMPETGLRWTHLIAICSIQGKKSWVEIIDKNVQKISVVH